MRPIPKSVLRSTATVAYCSGVDVYQNQTMTTQTVKNVHLQPTAAIVKTKDNTDCQLRSVLFVDAKLSAPAIDWQAILESAHALGGDVRVTVRGVEYTLVTVDALRGKTDQLHHWELGLA